MVEIKQTTAVIHQEKKDDKMNMEYFRQKQMRCEQCFKQINIGTVTLTVGISVFALGAITFIAFTLDGVDVFNAKSLPAASNPVTIMAVSLMFIVIVMSDRKIFDRLKKEI